MLVFVDETGTDMRDNLGKYGYSVRGKSAISHKLAFCGCWVSAIVAMTSNGILDYKLTQMLINLKGGLLLMLMNFNGRNPNSIVILDNCAIHHANDAAGLQREVGVMVHSYSPDL